MSARSAPIGSAQFDCAGVSLNSLNLMSYHQFQNVYGESYGSFETFLWDRFDCQDAGLIELKSDGWVRIESGFGGYGPVETNPEDWEGWYWQACFPGCLPDGDLMGPFSTEAEAIANANGE